MPVRGAPLVDRRPNIPRTRVAGDLTRIAGAERAHGAVVHPRTARCRPARRAPSMPGCECMLAPVRGSTVRAISHVCLWPAWVRGLTCGANTLVRTRATFVSTSGARARRRTTRRPRRCRRRCRGAFAARRARRESGGVAVPHDGSREDLEVARAGVAAEPAPGLPHASGARTGHIARSSGTAAGIRRTW